MGLVQRAWQENNCVTWDALKRVQGLGEKLHPSESKAAALPFRPCACGLPVMTELRIPNADGAGSDREKVHVQLGQECHSSCPSKCPIQLWWNHPILLLEKFLCKHTSQEQRWPLPCFLTFKLRVSKSVGRVIIQCLQIIYLCLSWSYSDTVPLLTAHFCEVPGPWVLHTSDHSIQKAVYVKIWKGSHFKSNFLFCTWTIIIIWFYDSIIITTIIIV